MDSRHRNSLVAKEYGVVGGYSLGVRIRTASAKRYPMLITATSLSIAPSPQMGQVPAHGKSRQYILCAAYEQNLVEY